MDEVRALIHKVRSTPGINNKPVLAVNVLEGQRSKNGGYPLHMYHESLDPVLALSEDEEQAVAEVGYGRHYIPKSYPKYLFRRNMDAKFKASDFIEEMVVRDAAAEKALLKKRAPANCGDWVEAAQEIEALPDAPTEDPAITIARLQGQLAAFQQEPAKDTEKKA